MNREWIRIRQLAFTAQTWMEHTEPLQIHKTQLTLFFLSLLFRLKVFSDFLLRGYEPSSPYVRSACAQTFVCAWALAPTVTRSNSALVASRSFCLIAPDLLPGLAGFLALKDASTFSCGARFHGYHEMANTVLELKSTSCYVVELPFNQNMEFAKDGTVLNSLSAPLRHFTSFACVSIQLAFAQRCLQMAASGTASLVGMLLEGKMAMSCIIAGGRFHGRILRELLDVGLDGKRQDTNNPDRVFDYHFSPVEVLNYTEALSDHT